MQSQIKTKGYSTPKDRKVPKYRKEDDYKRLEKEDDSLDYLGEEGDDKDSLPNLDNGIASTADQTITSPTCTPETAAVNTRTPEMAAPKSRTPETVVTATSTPETVTVDTSNPETIATVTSTSETVAVDTCPQETAAPATSTSSSNNMDCTDDSHTIQSYFTPLNDGTHDCPEALYNVVITPITDLDSQHVKNTCLHQLKVHLDSVYQVERRKHIDDLAVLRDSTSDQYT